MSRGEAVQKNLWMLVGAIAVMAAALGGSLWWALETMEDNTQRLSQQVIPAKYQLVQIFQVLGGAFGWQSRVNATTSTAQIEEINALRPPSEALQGHLKELEAVLRRSDSQEAQVALARLRPLQQRAEDFSQQQDALVEAVRRRHHLQETFNQQVEVTKTELQGLLQALASLQGRVRLRYMASLMEADRIAAGGAPSAGQRAVLYELTHGESRAAQEGLQELGAMSLQLGLIIGKIGLCNNADELNSILANEVKPTVAAIERRYDDLAELLQGRAAELEALQGARARSQKLLALSVGDQQSLQTLRRGILGEVLAAEEMRVAVQRSAEDLTSGFKHMQVAVHERVVSTVNEADDSRRKARWMGLLAGLAALAACVVALQRIRTSVSDLRESNHELERLRDHLRDANTTLEHKVQERTAALALRERAVQRLLDGMGEGVVQIGTDGRLFAERSRALEGWFGAQPDPDTLAWHYFFPEQEDAQIYFEMGLEQLREGFLPADLCVSQMPSRATRAGRTLDLRYRPVIEEGQDAPGALLVIASDVTAQLDAERAQREVQEIQQLISHLLQDRAGFMNFIQSGVLLLQQIEALDDAAALKMPLHTLKGNCAVYGAQSVASLCHDLESRLEEWAREGEPRSLSPAQKGALRAAWEGLLGRLSGFFGEDEDRLSLPREELAWLVQQLNGADQVALAQHVEAWLLEPARDNLERLALHAQRLAQKLDKMVQVQVEDNGVLLPPGFARDLWGELIHVIRNALDHGIEPPDERLQADKDAHGQLLLETEFRQDKLAIMVYDDGRGINWRGLAQKARALGLPCESRADLIEAMFCAGVSTAQEVTEISGRGVGTQAVKNVCEELGGRIEVESVEGRGTLFTLLLPIPIARRAPRWEPRAEA
jgi:HPt (histidine-containing phosphotransfer) domain-containing protein